MVTVVNPAAQVLDPGPSEPVESQSRLPHGILGIGDAAGHPVRDAERVAAVSFELGHGWHSARTG
jgi:hypothetical protein